MIFKNQLLASVEILPSGHLLESVLCLNIGPGLVRTRPHSCYVHLSAFSVSLYLIHFVIAILWTLYNINMYSLTNEIFHSLPRCGFRLAEDISRFSSFEFVDVSPTFGHFSTRSSLASHFLESSRPVAARNYRHFRQQQEGQSRLELEIGLSLLP